MYMGLSNQSAMNSQQSLLCSYIISSQKYEHNRLDDDITVKIKNWVLAKWRFIHIIDLSSLYEYIEIWLWPQSGDGEWRMHVWEVWCLPQSDDKHLHVWEGPHEEVGRVSHVDCVCPISTQLGCCRWKYCNQECHWNKFKKLRRMKS